MENMKKTLFLTLGIIVLLGLVGIVIVISKKNIKKEPSQSSSFLFSKPNSLSPTSSITSFLPSTTGQFILKTKNQKKIFSQNEPIIISVFADSSNQSISGYDVVLIFDQQRINFSSAKSLINDFQVFTQQKENKLFITGTKKLSANQPIVFSQTPILEITFQPKQKGQINIFFDYQPKSTKDSNLINEKTQDILEKVEGISLEISQ